MSPHGCPKMSAKLCNRNAEESFPVLSLKSWEQKPPNPLLIQDKNVLQPTPGLFRRIVRLGWHPLLRSNTGGTFRPIGTPGFRPLKSVVPQPGTRWRGRGTACQKAGQQVACPLWALGEDD